MSDVIEVLYRLRNMAGMEADKLRGQIAEAQQVLDKLDAFTNDAEDIGQLAAASDIGAGYHALIPERSGLTRKGETMAEVQLHARIKAFLDKNYPCCDVAGCCGEEEEAWAILDIVKAAGYGLVAEAKREAWDEGYEGAVDAYDGRNVSNPYRKASNDDQ